MTDSWDDYASEWDANDDAILYAEYAFKSLTESIDISNLKIFDFGCGTGLLTERLSPFANHIVALDSSKKMIDILEKKKLSNVTTLAVPLTLETMKEYQPLQNQFDLIVASSVCSFLPDYEATLVLIEKLLQPSGLFVQWDWLAQEDSSDTGLTVYQVQSALEKANINQVRISHPFSLKNSMKVLMAVAKK